MNIIDVEEKLRGIKLPEIKLDSHRLAFKKWVSDSKDALPWELPANAGQKRKGFIRKIRVLLGI